MTVPPAAAALALAGAELAELVLPAAAAALELLELLELAHAAASSATPSAMPILPAAGSRVIKELLIFVFPCLCLGSAC